MNLRGLFFAISVFYASAGGAETVAIQSGAHDGFTRLVLPIGTDANFSSETRKNGLQIKVNGSAAEFDASEVFKKIQRVHLDGISVGEVGGAHLIDLDYACACSAKLFRYKTEFLVVDISPNEKNATVVPRATGLPTPSFVGGGPRVSFAQPSRPRYRRS